MLAVSSSGHGRIVNTRGIARRTMNSLLKNSLGFQFRAQILIRLLTGVRVNLHVNTSLWLYREPKTLQPTLILKLGFNTRVP